jgi:hypothetical protein
MGGEVKGMEASTLQIFTIRICTIDTIQEFLIA